MSCRHRETGRTWTERLGAAVCLPALIAAATLYLVVTWAPQAERARDLSCACLVAVAAGGAATARRGGHQPWRLLGALAMLCGAFCLTLLWLG
jgi:hypothetical protein